MTLEARFDWYLKNLDQIILFRRYLDLLEDELPNKVAILLQDAAREVLGQAGKLSVDEEGGGAICIYLRDESNYEKKSGEGAYLYMASGENFIAWLKEPQSKKGPYIGLYYGKSDARGNRKLVQEIGEKAYKLATKTFSDNERDGANKPYSGHDLFTFIVAQKFLNITPRDFVNWDKSKAHLVSEISEFVRKSLPILQKMK